MGVHKLEYITNKYEISTIKIQVFRLISLAYAKTIHKIQGLSTFSCLIDIGSMTITRGQNYVALSIVSKLRGSHITIHFDFNSVKAPNQAIVKKYRPT